MPDILLELLCEEIPARMQIAAVEHLKKAITNGLVDAGLHYENAKAYVTPRRLALHVVNVPISTKPQIIERKGPRVGAPEGAIQGFLKAGGLTKIEDAEIQDDGKGGQFYIAKTQKDGQPTAAVLKLLIEKTIAEFPWPKSMRWGSGSLTWVRPLHNVCCTFSSDADVEVIEVEVENVTSKAETKGHTFLSPLSFQVKRFDDYMENLEANFVVLDRERRKQIIWHDAKTAAFAQGLEVIPDDGLLEEIVGLVEWPVVLMGSFDEAFLNIPERVIQTTIRVNQKCFVVKKTCHPERSEESYLDSSALPQNDSILSNHFILVSNLKAVDGGVTIIAGNERVIRARLSDAKFFWENDQKKTLEQHAEGLKNVVFHEKLGTQAERVERIERIAGKIIGDATKLSNLSNDLIPHVQQAVRLSKADLLTEMVGEFPELQGYMGRKYAEVEGLPESVCVAIEDHYKPRGPSEPVPTNKVAIAISLAEKMDILVSFWKINEKPTGSKDPYALRRAAIGIVRTILENKLPFKFNQFTRHFVSEHILDLDEREIIIDDLFKFFAERIRVQFIADGYAHDIVGAVMTGFESGIDRFNIPLPDIAARLSALKSLSTPQMHSILQGFRRVNNVLNSEQDKTDKNRFFMDVIEKCYEAVFETSHEKTLYETLQNQHKQFDVMIEKQNYQDILMLLIKTSDEIHNYIENTMINDPDPEIRLNRLKLLSRYRQLTRTVADFEKIEG